MSNFINTSDEINFAPENLVFKAVIIDDQEINRIYLYNLIKEHCREVEVVAMADNVENGVEVIKEHIPQIVFLDIELFSGTGFQVLEQVNRDSFEVIFTTGYEKYALQAIKNAALDYLQKPVDIEELRSAVRKVGKRKMQWNLSGTIEKNSEEKRISLNTGQGVEYICVSDIVRCESDHYYSFVYLMDGRRILLSKTLKEFEKLLFPYDFIRIHQSHLINLTHLKEFVKSENQVVLSDKSRIPVSRRKKDILLQKIS